MLSHLLALTMAPLLLAAGAAPPNRGEPDYGGQELEALYRRLGTGREQGTLTVRYATSRGLEVGWRVGFRQYGQTGPNITGRQVAIGPLWGVVAGRRGRASIFRFELNPWFTVASTLKDPTFADLAAADPAIDNRVKMPFGVDASLMLSVPIQVGKGMRIAPGVGYAGTTTYASGPISVTSPDPTVVTPVIGTLTKWDWQTGWRGALPVWLGQQQRLRLEFGYTRREHEGKYLQLGQERWDLNLAWRF